MSEEGSLPEEQESIALCAIVFYNNKFVEIYNKDATLQDICEALGIDVYNTEAYIVDRTTRHAVATLPSDCLPLMCANTHESRKEDKSTAHEQNDNNNNTFVDFWGEAGVDAHNDNPTDNISVAEEDLTNKEEIQKNANNSIVVEFELVTPNLHEASSEHHSEESESEEENEENTEREHENKHDDYDEEQHKEDHHHHNNIAFHETEHNNSSTRFTIENGVVNDNGGGNSQNKISTHALTGNDEAMQTLFKLAHKWHAVELLTAELPHRLATLPHYDPTASAADLLTSIVYHSGMYNPHRPQHDPLFFSSADCTRVDTINGNALYVNSVESYCVSSSVSSVLAHRPDLHPLTTEELEQVYHHNSENNIVDVEKGK